MRKSIFKYSVVAITGLILSACGSGGGGGNPPAGVTLSITIADSSVNIPESETASVNYSVSYSGSEQLQYEATTQDGTHLDVSVSDSAIQISSSDVSGLGVNDVITLTVTDGDKSASDSLSVEIDNTSFWSAYEPLMEQASALLEYSEYSIESLNVGIFYADVEYRIGMLGEGTLMDSINSVNSQTGEAQESFYQSINDIYTMVSQLPAQSDVTESDLEGIDEEMRRVAGIYAQDVGSVLNSLSVTSQGLLPEIDASELFESNGEYSMLIGNTQFGSYEGEQWVFLPEFAFLDKVINSNTCSASL